MSKAFIVGGTGMLAAASARFAGAYGDVFLAARDPAPLAEKTGAMALPFDWSDKKNATAVLKSLAEGPPFDLVVSWLHDDGLWCVPFLEALPKKNGRSIRVHGSAAGDPGKGLTTDPAPRDGIVRQNVVLGWVSEGTGRRWLTHEEISRGVMKAFETPRELAFVVGTLRSPG
jgi:hypothetical protein